MVFYAFVANLVIACVKLFVAFITRSSAMLAEAIHSGADTLNQVFLLIGIRRGRRQPDNLHPFGFSGELYFWSFIVAIMLFTLGAFFSIYEGIHKLRHPVRLERIEYALLVLAVSLILEGIAFGRALRKVNGERHGKGLVDYLKQTKKSELIVVFMEDLAAITGLLIALFLLGIQRLTGLVILDGIASICIGVILAFVAFFLGYETKSLLIGEAADAALILGVTEIFSAEESINTLIQIKSLQMGPEDVLLAVKAEFNPLLTAVEISHLINGIEADIRGRFPQVKKIFIEPDILRR